MMKARIASVVAGALFTAAALTSGPALAQQKLVLKASDVHPGRLSRPSVGGRGYRQETREGHQWPLERADVSVNATRRREGSDRAGAGRRYRICARLGRRARPVVDELNVFNLPYVFRNTTHMQKVIDGPIGQDLLDKVTNSGKGLIGLAWMDAGARNFYNTKKPIKTMADLKGMKVRVMGNPMFVEMANSMGGNGVAMGYDQVFNALQTGVVDGAENNPPSFVFDNHYQVAKFYTVDEHLIVPEMVVFSKKIWDTLSKEEQAAAGEIWP
jgi:hypothetical protein